MKSTYLRFVALMLAMITVLSLVACGGASSSEGSGTTDDETTVATNDASNQEHDSSPNTQPFQKAPLTHLIFGNRSYAQGENLIGEISWEALPLTFVSPYTMKVENMDEWMKFYGGIPRTKMDEDFVTGISQIDEGFFKSKYLVVVIVLEKSNTYTHEVKSVEPKEGALHVDIVTHTTQAATNETAVRCIMIPASRDYSPLPIKVSIGKELNG